MDDLMAGQRHLLVSQLEPLVKGFAVFYAAIFVLVIVLCGLQFLTDKQKD